MEFTTGKAINLNYYEYSKSSYHMVVMGRLFLSKNRIGK
ncbi:hypothetical protein SAMN05421640_2199 [Ekhidna lutea]|uniref:Uncharacterized protein n=1 Tax=Ekhidna lutea TaxID=447679 RepID=A0A239JIZ6_EKHLU|nr:hypothetical protein SAMN05421640_2199 [Ekhidna lutea]